MSIFNAKPKLLAHTLYASVLSFGLLGGLAHGEEHDTDKANQQGHSTSSWQSGLHRTDLISHDLASTDQKVIQVQVDFDPGVAAPKHSHPGVEIAYVVKGNFEYVLDGQPPVSLKAGDSLYIPPGVPHVAKNTGKGVGSELATYIVDKSLPLVKLEK